MCGWQKLLWSSFVVLAVLAAPLPATAAEEASAQNDPATSLAAQIDVLVSQRWAAESIRPTGPVDDATFVRRVSLDISGRVPAVGDLHDFLDDRSPGKRRKLVDRLLEGPGYINHFATLWRKVLMPEVESNLELRNLAPAFESWLRKQLNDNTRYDALVREIITVNVDPRNARNQFAAQTELSPVSFYQTKELKPENLAAGTARMFLGVRLECAQCHDHPFDDWKREQFWSYAAFFASLARLGMADQADVNAIREEFDRREIEIPGTNRKVTPTYLSGQRPDFKLHENARARLAEWMTGAENPYFARTVVNRLWGHFFGVGIVDPVDDFTGGNPPSHPELLDLLAREFAAQKFDLKFLIRAITASKTYQLSSDQTHPTQENPRLFAKMPVRGLSPEQIFDSIAQATGYFEPYGNRNQMMLQTNVPREEFLRMFENGRDTSTDRQTTILQALAIMNGQFVADATSLDKSATLAAVAGFPQMTTGERIEALYLAALGRPPRGDELVKLGKYVNEGGAAQDPKKALSDVFWVLLNSSEFLFNR